MQKSGRKLVGSIASTVLIVVGVVFGMPFFGLGASSCMGYNDVVMSRLRACPQAQQVLGDDIGPAYVGMSCGSAETEGAFGRASWSMPVRGTKARGTYQFAVEKRGGGWQMLSGSLSAGGQVVDIASCTPGAGGGGLMAPSAFTGTATAVTGSAPVAQGSPCTVTVTPVSAGQFNCRVAVQCGGSILYGSGQGGYTTCLTIPDATGGSAISAQDAQMTPADNDPSMSLQTAANLATVSDQGPAGVWSVSVQLAPPAGAVSPPPPAVEPVPPMPGVPPAAGAPTPPGVPPAVAAAPGAASPWDGTSTFQCTGSQNVTITGQTVTLEGSRAINASGNCQLTLVSCTIRAQEVVSASGNAHVTIVGGRIEGTDAAMSLSGNALVTVQGAEVVGLVRRSGAARVEGMP